jgi:hypothetical protein
MNTCSTEEPMQQSDPISDWGRETAFDRTAAVRERLLVEYEHRKASHLEEYRNISIICSVDASFDLFGEMRHSQYMTSDGG